jgi:conjugal transfer/entry exclusion protein
MKNRVALALLILLAPSVPKAADAQWVVHDPINGVTLIDQKLNQMRQIANEVQQLQYQLRNLTPYSTNWSSLVSQITALRAQIIRNAPTVDNANAQLSQMSNELSTLQQLQSLSNNSQGSMQVAQTTNTLVATLIGQVQKQRALTINAIREEEQNKAAAYAALYGPSQLKK